MMILPADKGRATVLLDRFSNEEKVNVLLSEEGMYKNALEIQLLHYSVSFARPDIFFQSSMKD